MKSFFVKCASSAFAFAVWVGPACAQDAATVTNGTNFARSLAPTSASQVVNPTGVSTTAWAGQTSTPTAPPSSMGAFSTPTSTSSIYTSAKGLGLTALGNQAITDCESHVPGADPVKDQACAATNFLSNRCLPTNSTEGKIITSTGTGAGGIAPDCTGSYGAGISKFNFNNTVTPSDMIFATMTGLKSTAPSTLGNVCTTVPGVKGAYTINTCTMSKDASEYACSQYQNSKFITEYSYVASSGDGCEGYGSAATLDSASSVNALIDSSSGLPYTGIAHPNNRYFYPNETWPEGGSGPYWGYETYYRIGSEPNYCTGSVQTMTLGSTVEKWYDTGFTPLSFLLNQINKHTAFPGRPVVMVKFGDPWALVFNGFGTIFSGGVSQTYYDGRATVYYGPVASVSCASGGVLTAGICRNVSTVTSTVPGFNCTPGDATCRVTAVTTKQLSDTCSTSLPPNTSCMKVTEETSWFNDCAGYEASSGKTLSAPTN